MKHRQPSSRVKPDPNRMREFLNRLHMNQNELARPSGTWSGYMSQLISGTRYPSAKLRGRLIKALGAARFEDPFILEVVS